MEQQHRRRWQGRLRAWLDPLTTFVVVLIGLGIALFVVGYAQPSALLQALGAIIFGGGLSALLGTFTGHQAIREQSAKEASLWRKEHVYGPLFAELKSLRTAFSVAKSGEAPAPQTIDNAVAPDTENGQYFNPQIVAIPTLTEWPRLRRGFHDNDFSPSAQSLLDEVQTLASAYNKAVEAARQAAIPILASCITAAINDEKKPSDRYARWKRQQAAHEASAALSGHTLKTTFDWFYYFDDAIPYIVAMQWLTSWPASIAPPSSRVLGWLLARQSGKAAGYVQRNYPAEGAGMYPPPPLDWIQPIFEQAIPALEQNAAFRNATDASEMLVRRVQEAMDVLSDELRRIQERYEGGKPSI